MDQSPILDFIAQYWQFVFLYVFKYLKDIADIMKKLEIDIAVLKHENKRRTTDFQKHQV